MEELNQKISTLEKEKNKEEEYRNYMQLERVSDERRRHACAALRCGRTPLPGLQLPL